MVFRVKKSDTTTSSGTTTEPTTMTASATEPTATTTATVSEPTVTTTATTEPVIEATATTTTTNGNKPASNPGQGYINRSGSATENSNSVYVNPNMDEQRIELGIVAGETNTGSGGTNTQPTYDDYIGEEPVVIGNGPEQVFYFHPDHLGSTSYITDESGALSEHVEYFPFGETWVSEGGGDNSYLYTSKEYDTETGLYYYGARYYDPRTSVWVSADPIFAEYLPNFDHKISKQNPGKVNGVFDSKNIGLYTYSHNRPVILKDPDGNNAVAARIIIGFGIGYALEGASQSYLEEKQELDQGRMVVSGLTTALGVGLGNKLDKAVKLSKSQKFMSKLAMTFGLATGSEAIKNEMKDPKDQVSGREVLERGAISTVSSLTVGKFVDSKVSNKIGEASQYIQAGTMSSGAVSAAIKNSMTGASNNGGMSGVIDRSNRHGVIER